MVCNETICGKHCLNLIDKIFNRDYYYHVVMKKFLDKDNENLLMKFKKCGCSTHRFCLMYYASNFKNKLCCPTCDKVIIENQHLILNTVAVRTLFVEQQMLNNQKVTDTIFDKY